METNTSVCIFGFSATRRMCRPGFREISTSVRPESADRGRYTTSRRERPGGNRSPPDVALAARSEHDGEVRNHAETNSEFAAQEFWPGARRNDGASPGNGAMTEAQRRARVKGPAEKSEVISACWSVPCRSGWRPVRSGWQTPGGDGQLAGLPGQHLSEAEGGAAAEAPRVHLALAAG